MGEGSDSCEEAGDLVEKLAAILLDLGPESQQRLIGRGIGPGMPGGKNHQLRQGKQHRINSDSGPGQDRCRCLSAQIDIWQILA